MILSPGLNWSTYFATAGSKGALATSVFADASNETIWAYQKYVRFSKDVGACAVTLETVATTASSISPAPTSVLFMRPPRVVLLQTGSPDLHTCRPLCQSLHLTLRLGSLHRFAVCG